MNETINKFLLSGDKFMPEMHLRQPGFTYSACSQFTKNKEKTKKIIETGDSRYIYQNGLDQACFQHDMSYGDFKDSNRRTAVDKQQLIKYDVIKHLILLKIHNMMDINVDLLQWFITFLIKKSCCGVKNENISNKN